MKIAEIIKTMVITAAQKVAKLTEAFVAPVTNSPMVAVKRIEKGFAITLYLIPLGRWSDAPKDEVEEYFAKYISHDIASELTGDGDIASDVTAEFDSDGIEPILTLKMILEVED